MLFISAVLALLVASVNGDYSETTTLGLSTTVLETTVSIIQSTTTLTTWVDKTVEVVLPVSTLSVLIHPSPVTFTNWINQGTTKVVTSTIGNGQTVTVPNTANPTVTVPVVTITASGTKTIYSTATGVNIVTKFVTSGYTTVNSCVPTTTIISTVTTAVPTATSPAGDVVTFHRQNCASVVCAAGFSTVTTNGVAKACTLIYYKGALISTTCMVEYCCADSSVSTGPTIRPTTCAASGLSCPAGSNMLATAGGASVPCLHSYLKNQLVASTCDQSVCCSAAQTGNTVTVTAGNSDGGAVVTVKPTASTGKTISCKKSVKCTVYDKNPKTNYIKRCHDNSDDEDEMSCSSAYCCKTIRK